MRQGPFLSLIKSVGSTQKLKTVSEVRSRSNSLAVQPGLGGGRCAARCRHGQKGGRRCGGGYGDDGCGLLLERGDRGSGGGLCDTEALGQGREGAGGGIAEGALRCEQCRQQDVDPRMG